MNAKILCVDDEQHVLDSLALHLRRIYDVVTATDGQAGLAAIVSQGPFAIILSDMRMPGMNGAAFLEKARLIAPDTVRLLLTGYSDQETAITAVNQGQIFRFLTKPCPPDQLRDALSAAVTQYDLITAEHVLLEQTLKGCIQALTDILALANPLSFGRATRISHITRELAAQLDLPDRWQVEVAAMLSMLGSITVPDETIRRYYAGEPLSPPEKAMIERMPELAQNLLANIPRLDPIQDILCHLSPASSHNRTTPIGAKVLRVAMDYDELTQSGMPARLAIDTLRGRYGRYQPAILDALLKLLATEDPSHEVREVSLRGLCVGMVLVGDVRTTSGLLLLAHGSPVTTSFIERARNFGSQNIVQPIRVIIRT